MSEQLDVLKLIVSRLDAARVPYMISGSTAMNYYAQPRMTRDIDIVIELVPDAVGRLVRSLGEDFHYDEDRIHLAAVNRAMFNLIHLPSVIKVDLIVRKDTPYRAEEFARRRSVTMDDLAIWLVSPEDLILSKLAWAKNSHSEVQLSDVRNLAHAVRDLDWTYVERWAAELTVVQLLKEIHA